MQPLKFNEAGKIHKPVPVLFKNIACTRTQDAFIENARRAVNLLVIPSWSFIAYDRYTDAATAAIKCVLGENATEENLKNKVCEVEQATDEIIAAMPAETDVKMRRLFAVADDNLERVSRHSIGLGIHEAFEGLLQSVVIQSWTAVEIAAAQLHEESRQKHPECFAPNLVSAKYGFRSMRTLTESYEKAFGCDKKIDGIVQGRDIKALALLRHLLAHSKGIVDQIHLTQRAQKPVVNDFDAFGLNHKIEVDGQMVCSLVDGGIKQVYKLLHAVDEWLTIHRPI